ncbi:MAG: AMP-binding protein [Candidatus Marinimicrobia bacterium]|nr:AMP-binding protein [Candidatus Neomarinimicrobiota bacterium]
MSWLQNQILQNSEKLFIQKGDQQYTISEVGNMVSTYSRALIKEGISRQDRILIYLPSTVEFIEIILACFEIGAVAVPISPKLTESERDAINDKIQPKLIITNWQLKPIHTSFSLPLAPVSFIEELPNASSGCSSFNNDYKYNTDDIAAIILTSGTTGTPKAVQLTYGNFEASCNNWNGFLQFQKTDQFLCCLPLHHIGGLAVMLRALKFGFSINLVSTFEAQLVLNTMIKYPVTIISLVPTMLKRILDIEGGLTALKTLRWILLGGGPSPEYLLDLCIKKQLNIVKVYGMSETCSGTVGLKLLDEPHNKLYAGRPFSGAKIWSENDELHISGPMVMKGYVGETETNNSHNTHDLGRVDEDNLIFLDIRRKDLIITGGENVNPIEVEEALLKIDGITDAAVVGMEDEEWGQKVVAYIVISEFGIRNSDLKIKLTEQLSNFKIPKEFIQVPNIPRNELGKIEYEKLQKSQIPI